MTQNFKTFINDDEHLVSLDIPLLNGYEPSTDSFTSRRGVFVADSAALIDGARCRHVCNAPTATENKAGSNGM